MPAPTPISVTALLQNIAGAAATSGAKLRITLCGFDQVQPEIPGTSLLVTISQSQTFIGALLTFPLYANDVINPLNPDGTPKTFYCVQVQDSNGNTIAATNYQILTSGGTNQDLSNLEPYDPSVVDGIYVLPQSACIGTIFDGNKGTGQSLTLTGNIAASSARNFVRGEAVPFIIKQDGVGGRAFAWPGSFADQPAINPAPNGVTTALFFLGFDGNYHQFGASIWV